MPLIVRGDTNEIKIAQVKKQIKEKQNLSNKNETQNNISKPLHINFQKINESLNVSNKEQNSKKIDQTSNDESKEEKISSNKNEENNNDSSDSENDSSDSDSSDSDNDSNKESDSSDNDSDSSDSDSSDSDNDSNKKSDNSNKNQSIVNNNDKKQISSEKNVAPITVSNAPMEKSKEAGQLFSLSSFSSLNVNTRLTKHLQEKMNLHKPTKIQEACITPFLAGRDILIKASTGSGKTLAYLIPLIHKLIQIRTDRAEGTRVLIVTPTRELAQQTEMVAKNLASPFSWIVIGVLSGGHKRKAEKASIRKGITILIATPGRLLDHLASTYSFKIDLLGWLVLDEADLLLEMGFEREIKKIMKTIEERCENVQSTIKSSTRQTILISATLEERITKFASSYMKDKKAVFINAETLPNNIEPNKNEKVSQLDFNQIIDNDNQDQDWGWEDLGYPQNEAAYVNKLDKSKVVSEEYSVPPGLIQHFVSTPAKLRLVTLIAFIVQRIMRGEKAIVFVSNIATVEFLYALLAQLHEILPEELYPNLVENLEDSDKKIKKKNQIKLKKN
eukprot:TRINITY_DN35_c0_g1_i2.p1 TRINITY_DN35_c0_g1~~TRINITY_DN35_c0_g1_i2.p1  ORF type:complete len:560 (+),score=256.80 TRINITY_DN35_c0_g1_i2:77-1756(+)